MEIVKAFSKIIIPIKHNKNFNELESIIEKKQKKFFVWEKFNFSITHVLENLENKISHSKHSIAQSYVLNSNIRDCFSLPKNVNGRIDIVKRDNATSQFYIPSVYLHIFETGIGFIEFQCEALKMEDNDFLALNYFITELKSNKNKLQFTKNISRDEKETIVTSIKEIISLLIETIEGAAFFSENSYNPHDYKPVLFSYVLLPDKPNNIPELLYLGSNIYKSSYKYNKSKQDYYQPFDNSYWGSSFQGAINISYLTNDNTTNDFFLNTFPGSLKNHYFFLFLLALNQKFTMLKHTGDINKLMFYDLENADQLLQLKKEIDITINKISRFNTRSYFCNVSFITQINQFYGLIQNKFLIDNLYRELNSKVENLKLLSDRYYNQYEISLHKQNEKRELHKQIHQIKVTIYVNIITQIVGGLSIFKLLWDILVLVTKNSLEFNVYFIISAVVFVLFILIMSYELIAPAKKIKELKKRLGED